MFRSVFLLVIFAFTSISTFSAESTNSLATEANRKGQEDWNQGDPINAIPKLKVAADNGNAEAQALLGYILDQADNDVEAAHYYKLAADLGNADGLFGLATFYLSGEGNLKQDLPLARSLLFKAAETSHQPSIMAISMSYLSGGLGLTEEERNSIRALDWIKKGADLGNINAKLRVIEAHRKGDFGLPINVDEANRLQKEVDSLLGVDQSKKRRRRYP